MTKSIGWLKLLKESSQMAMSQEDWSTGDKHAAFSSAEIHHYTIEELFDEVVTFKNGESVYLVEASIEGDRAKAIYSPEQPQVKKAPVKKTKATKKNKKED